MTDDAQSAARAEAVEALAAAARVALAAGVPVADITTALRRPASPLEDAPADAWDAADEWLGAIGGMAGIVGGAIHGGRIRQAVDWIGPGIGALRAILGAIREGRTLEPIPRVEDILPAELSTTIARRAAEAAARERFEAPPDDGGDPAP